MLRLMHMRVLALPLLLALAGCGASAEVLDSASPAPSRPAATPLLPTEPAVPDPSATLHVARGQSVVLHHCGVVNIAYDGQEWEVENAPFDATNAPPSFSGFGSFERTGEALLFTDDRGATLSFTPSDGQADPSVCA